MKSSIKIIKINGKCFSLPLIPIDENYMGATGKTYRLQKEGLDLAVKIYHTEQIILDKEPEEIVFPDEETLEYFIDYSKDCYPFLLSSYKVTDIDNHYIGCASPYVTETRGKTKEAIYKLPIHLLLEYLYKIQNKIDFLDEYFISIDDLSLDNIKIGTVGDGEEGILVFDDSEYEIKFDTSRNNLALNFLIVDILFKYILSKNYTKLQDVLFEELQREGDYLRFLEKNCITFKNLASYLDHLNQKIENKHFTKKRII